MKSHLQFVSTKDWTRQQWLDYRLTGLGGSEMSTVLGQNKYQSSMELWRIKTLQMPQRDEEKFTMYRGEVQEDLIVEQYWRYWTTEDEFFINRRNPDFIRRKCQRVLGYVRNPKFPWIFASVDRLMNIGNVNLLTGEILDEQGVLECKTIGKHVSDQWEAGIPPAYVIQLQTYLAVYELQYGEMAILIDGTYPYVLPFERNEAIIEAILEQSEAFWIRVEETKRLLILKAEAETNSDYSAVEDISAQLMRQEPEPDGSGGWTDFLKEEYRDSVPTSTMEGSEEHLEKARAARRLKDEIAEKNTELAGFENHLKKAMGNYEEMTFGTDGKITWKTNAKARPFLNKVKL